MSLSEEIERLRALHDAGTLSADEFQRAKTRVLDGEVHVSPAEINKLRRARSDRWIAGVCAGVARLTGIEAWVWRLSLTVLAVFGGTGLLIYILLWIFVPSE